MRGGLAEDLPDGAADFSLVFGEVDALEDHVFAIAHVVVFVFVAHIAAVGLAVVQRRTAILRVVLQLLVDHFLKSARP